MEETKQEDGYNKELQIAAEDIIHENQAGAESGSPQTVHLVSEEKMKTIVDDLKTKPTFCLIHQQTEVSLFCMTCEKLVCISCIIDGNHGNHKFCKIDDVVETKQKELGDRIVEAKESMTGSLQQNIRILKTQRENVSDNCKTVSAEIDERKTNLLRGVETCSINLHSMVREQQKKILQRIDKFLLQSELCLAYLDFFQTNPKCIETIDSKKLIQVLELFQTNTGVQAKEESEAPEGEDSLIFTPGEEALENIHILFGKVTGIPLTENPRNKKFKFCNSEVMNLSPLDGERAFVVTEEKLYLVDLMKAKYKQEDLVPLMTDVVYITPVTKRGIYVQQKDSTIVKRVTAAGQVFHFADLEPKAINEVWQTIRISHTGMVVSVTKIEVKKIFGSQGKDVIKMTTYTNHGIMKKGSFTFNNSDNHFCYGRKFPESVITASAIYILSSENKVGRIKNLKQQWFDQNQEYKGCIGSAPEQMFYPRGLCKDAENQLIVSDYWNHAIHQLTPEGKFSKFLMREENDLIHPTVVGIDNINWMWVAQDDGNIHVVKYTA